MDEIMNSRSKGLGFEANYRTCVEVCWVNCNFPFVLTTKFMCDSYSGKHACYLYVHTQIPCRNIIMAIYNHQTDCCWAWYQIW